MFPSPRRPDVFEFSYTSNYVYTCIEKKIITIKNNWYDKSNVQPENHSFCNLVANTRVV